MTASLIERLEAATEGSQDIDAEICIALQYGGLNSEDGQNVRTDPDWEGDLLYEIGAEECCCPIPPVTTSLDAALALAERVLPGGYTVRADIDSDRSDISIDPPWKSLNGPPRPFFGIAKTPALALCIAILKAQP